MILGKFSTVLQHQPSFHGIPVCKGAGACSHRELMQHAIDKHCGPPPCVLPHSRGNRPATGKCSTPAGQLSNHSHTGISLRKDSESSMTFLGVLPWFCIYKCIRKPFSIDLPLHWSNSATYLKRKMENYNINLYFTSSQDTFLLRKNTY